MAGDGAVKEPSGYLEVADFVHVVWFDKELYPKGVKKYHVSKGDEAVVEEKQA